MNKSFAAIATDVVITMCRDTLKHIQEQQQQERQAVINQMVRDSETSWFRKLFRRPTLTIEEATKIYWLDAKRPGGGFWHPEVSISMYAWRSQEIAKRVLALAQSTKELHVMVTADDLRYIQ